MPEQFYPLPSKFVLRIAVVLVVVLAILAGYYQNRFYFWKQNHVQVLQRLNVKTTQEALKKSWEEVK